MVWFIGYFLWGLFQKLWGGGSKEYPSPELKGGPVKIFEAACLKINFNGIVALKISLKLHKCRLRGLLLLTRYSSIMWKAFDCVSHEKLFIKLESYGVP